MGSGCGLALSCGQWVWLSTVMWAVGVASSGSCYNSAMTASTCPLLEHAVSGSWFTSVRTDILFTLADGSQVQQVSNQSGPSGCHSNISVLCTQHAMIMCVLSSSPDPPPYGCGSGSMCWPFWYMQWVWLLMLTSLV